jgi:NTE family protein
MTKEKLAFVLSGGGAYGALQVGALRALFEAGIHPDMLVGTSIGAINSAYLAIKGVNLQGVHNLTWAWRETVGTEILPPNYLWLSVRQLFGRPETTPIQHLLNFFLAHGIPQDIHFGAINGVELYVVAADLNSCQKVVFGTNPADTILEGILASAALPPWIQPIQKENRYLVDGAFVSNLPIETALELGANAIIALDLFDPMGIRSEVEKTKPFVGKMMDTVLNRYRTLELALAEARGVPLHNIVLTAIKDLPIWNFDQSDELIELGYEICSKEVNNWQKDDFAWKWSNLVENDLVISHHFGHVPPE